jgi:hypothetical protein
VADFRLNVTADTRDASSKLQAIDQAADQATKQRTLRIDVNQLSKNFKDIDKNVKEASNTVQQFYRISKNIPGVGNRIQEFEALTKGTANLAKAAPSAAAGLRENAKAGTILATSFETAGGAINTLVNNLARTGLALFAVKQAVGVLQSVFGGFFDSTIGREIKLRETLLKTQTTLASNNKVFSNGKEVTDPLQKIKALSGPVKEAIDDIRIKSLELSGTTSEQVIEVFGVVASQISQVGGGIKEAKDLAISFSAALATFGLPFQQARQEIGSILRGDITQDSYLAKALGIDNAAIAKAKTQTGGVIKFVEDKLATAVAGQAIAAQGFAGITSNIQEIAQLVLQNFGAGLLDPLLGGLTSVYAFLFKIGAKLKDLSKAAGEGIGGTLASIGSQVGGGSSLLQKVSGGAGDFTTQLTEGVKQAFASLQADANQIIAPLRNIIEQIALSIGVVAKGLGDLAKGFVSINIENIKALAQLISNLIGTVTTLAGAFGGLLSAYGQILQAPMVQYISQITVQFQLLEKTGVMAAIKLGFVALGLVAAWKPIIAFFQTLVARIATLLGGLVIAFGLVVVQIGQIIAKFAATLTASIPAVAALKNELNALSQTLVTTGVAADTAGNKIGKLGGATAGAAGKVGSVIFNAIKLNLILFAIQAAVTIALDAFSKFQQEQEKIAREKRAEQALKELRTTYKNVGDTASESTKRAKEFHEALVNAQYTDALDRLEKIRAKLQEINDLTSGNKQDFGDYLRRLAQLFNPENMTVSQKPGETFSDAVYRRKLEEEKKIVTERDKWGKEVDAQSLGEKITLEANKRTDLSKEIAELERGHASKLFELRQQAANKEVEIFRLAGELRIAEVERANAKMLKGQEGASAVAIEALNKYLATRERGELEIEAAKQQLHIESANLDKSVADYRVAIEKQIAEIKKKSNENDIATADYRKQQLLAGGATGAAGSGDSISAAVAATKNLTGVNNQCAEAVKRFMAVIGVNSSVMTKAALSAEKMGTVMTDWSKLQAGDIVARGGKGDPEHVGVFTGGQNVFHQSAGRGLKAGNYPDLGYFKEKGYFIRPSGMAAGAGPVAKPVLQEASKLRDPKQMGNEVAAITGSIKNLNAQTAELRAQATNASTKAAFDAIFDGLFPQVPIEGAQNDLIERFNKINSLLLSTGANTAASTAEQKFADIKAETQTQVEILKREVAQVKAEFDKRRTSTDPRNKLSDSQANELNGRADKGMQTRIKELEQLERVKKAVAAADNYQESLTRQQQLVIQFNQQTKAIKEEAEARRISNRLRMEGFSEEAIQNELRKLKLDQEFKKEAELLDAQYLLMQNSLAQYNLEQAKGVILTDAQKQEAQKLIDKLDELKKKREELQGDRDKAKTEGDAAVKGAEETPKDKIEGRIGQLKKDLKDLTNLGNIVTGTAEAIGSAFSQSFQGVITGSMTAKEALNSFFQSIASYFMDMATKIIAKWIEMIILNSVLQLFGAAAGGAAGGAAGKIGNSSLADISKYAVPLPGLATGGPVTAGSPYIVGEKGPELFVPGNTGSIISNTRTEALMASRGALRGGSGSSSSAFADNRESLNNVSSINRERMVERVLTSGAGSTEIRYNRVGSGDLPFVTEADMLQATRVAAQEGARMGQQRTIAALKSNPGARRSIGI